MAAERSNFMHVHITKQLIESLMYYKIKPVLEIRIEYPEISGNLQKVSEESFNKFYQIQSRIKNRRARNYYYKMAVRDFKASADNDYPFNMYTFYSTYDVTFLSDSIASLYFDEYVYTGGAHGNTERISNTWDLKDGRLKQLRDFFKPNFNYRAVMTDNIIKQINKSENREDYFPEYEKLVKQYFSDKNFYLSTDGFIIFYPLYTIAPYYMGIQTFLLPFSLFE